MPFMHEHKNPHHGEDKGRERISVNMKFHALRSMAVQRPIPKNRECDPNGALF